jgi:hypothetical protein
MRYTGKPSVPLCYAVRLRRDQTTSNRLELYLRQRILAVYALNRTATVRLLLSPPRIEDGAFDESTPAAEFQYRWMDDPRDIP